MSRTFTRLKTLGVLSLLLGSAGGAFAGPGQAFAADGAGTATVKQASGALSIDGVVETDEGGAPAGEWVGADALTIAGVTDGGGNAHGAAIYVKYDADNLYVGAVIQDPTPMINENTGSNIWNGDNLELFFGTADLANKPDGMLPSDVQVVISGSVSNGAQSYVFTNGNFAFPAFPLAAKRAADKKGYTLEAAIPLGELGLTEPWDGKQMLMNAVLNDGGSSGRGQWGWTTTGETKKKFRSQWGLASLEPGTAPAQNITADVSVSDANMVTVTGQTQGVAGKDVTLLVTGPGGTGSPVYVDQTTSDAQGRYSFRFPMTSASVAGADAGIYTATVGGEGVARPASVTFDFTPGSPAPDDPPIVYPGGGGGSTTGGAGTGDDGSGGQTGGGDQGDKPALTDIAGHWAADAIQRAVALGIVTGYEDETFRPDRAVTRGEFAVMLSRAFKPAAAAGLLGFKDADAVPAWAADAVGRAAGAGWIGGYEDGTFRAGQPITRAELAAMAVRAMGWTPEASAVPAFADAAAIAPWARPYAALAAEKGLMNGRGGNLFVPGGITTRAEAAQLLIRMLDAKTTEGG
ncbi:S-layer homology domain-containing protein [Paenibacillus sp. MWE-103]|uniref:S-layer homology domain-containing protein n=1 Tax=Paenibacillus artemisiicola TaxID=1172618 RepID=A0ABS3WIQ1_9BACL|nr:S-layer homology domain-containing protein [Paenibacillus artemisiicola]MBO7748123.1 S-layer homology domain-containing protein [Paenibacillus artemisiicola]